MLNRRKHYVVQNRQRGFAMLDLSMAMLLMAGMAAANLSARALAQQLSFAAMEGSALAELSAAGDTYTQEHFNELQNGLAVSHGSTSLLPGADSGQTYAPRVEDLGAMNYLPAGFKADSLYSRGGAPGKYVFKISRTPEGCQITDSTKCGLVGYVYIDKPILGGTNSSVDGPAINVMMAKLGNKGCTSLISSPAVMIGGGGDCGMVNPVSGNPAGVVLARFGFGASGLANFVRLNDTRDPNLRGKLTVANTSKAHEFVTDVKMVGGVCDVQNSIGSGVSGAVICIGSAWRSLGGDWTNIGESCSPEGKSAFNIGNGEQLICKGGSYKKLVSYMAKSVLISRQQVSDGSVVNKPVCDPGGTADRSFTMVQTSANLTTAPPMAAMELSTIDLGSAWSVSIKVKDDNNNEESGNIHAVKQILNLECTY